MGLFSNSSKEVESSIKFQKEMVEKMKKQGRDRESDVAAVAVKRLEQELIELKKKGK